VIQTFQLIDVALDISRVLTNVLLQARKCLKISLDVARIVVAKKVLGDHGDGLEVTREILHVGLDVTDECCFGRHSHVLISLVKEGSLGSLLTKTFAMIKDVSKAKNIGFDRYRIVRL
jgi:hypothetical protein